MDKKYFIYMDTRGNVTSRQITNFSTSTDYIQGFCLTAHALRTFRKDRILEEVPVNKKIQKNLDKNNKAVIFSIHNLKGDFMNKKSKSEISKDKNIDKETFKIRIHDQKFNANDIFVKGQTKKIKEIIEIEGHKGCFPNCPIRKISPDGKITTLASQDEITEKLFYYPQGIAVDTSENVYVADSMNNRILKISPDETITILKRSSIKKNGNRIVTEIQFSYPTSVAVDDSNNIYVEDKNNSRIQKISPNGAVNTLKSKNRSIEESFNYPTGVAVDASKNVYIVDDKKIKEIQEQSRMIDIMNKKSEEEEIINCIRKITPEEVVSKITDNIEIHKNETSDMTKYNFITKIIVDKFNNIHISDQGNHRIRKITKEGMVSTLAGKNKKGYKDGIATEALFCYPYDIAVDTSNNIYVTDTRNYCIRKITKEGMVSTLAGKNKKGYKDGIATEALFDTPTGIAIDAFNNIYIIEYEKHCIRKITKEGIVSTLAKNTVTNSQFFYPSGIAVDTSNNIYVSNSIHDFYEGYDEQIS